MGKAVNALIKVIHGIKGDSNKVKIAPRKSKQPNLEVLKYIKGGKYSEEEVGKKMHMLLERDNPEKVENIQGFNSQYLMM